MKGHRGLFHMLAVLVVVTQIGIVTSIFNGVVMAAREQEAPTEIAAIKAPFDMPQLKRPVFADRVFNIVNYGAVECKWVESEKRKSIDGIAKAIEACHESGGGKVVPPAGDWLAGAIQLKSNVNLHITDGAVVHFSNDLADYLPLVHIRSEGVECFNYSPFIYAPHTENIAITGKGPLHGHCRWWWQWMEKHYHRMNRFKASEIPLKQRPFGKGTGMQGLRPFFIMPWKANNILIEGITLIESPMWNVHPVYSENIIIRGISIYSLETPTGDGVNPDSCKNVLIEYNHFETGDEAVTIKSGLNKDGFEIGIPCENIVVRNFTARDVRTGSGGIVFCRETSGGIRSVYVHDAVFDGCDWGIRFKTARGHGNVIENITIEDIRMENIENQAINFNSYYDRDVVGNSPLFRNITIQNVRVNGAHMALETIRLPEKWLENINIKNAVFENVGNGAVVHRVKELTLENVTIKSTFCPVSLHDVFGASRKNVKLFGQQPPVQISGSESGAIKIEGLDHDRVEIKGDVPPGAVNIDTQRDSKPQPPETIKSQASRSVRSAAAKHPFSRSREIIFGCYTEDLAQFRSLPSGPKPWGRPTSPLLLKICRLPTGN